MKKSAKGKTEFFRPTALKTGLALALFVISLSYQSSYTLSSCGALQVFVEAEGRGWPLPVLEQTSPPCGYGEGLNVLGVAGNAVFYFLLAAFAVEAYKQRLRKSNS